MKNFIITAVLAVAALGATAAQAEDLKNFGKVEYAFRDYEGSANKNGANITLGREVAPGIKLDGKVEFRHENGSEKISNRAEVGATYTYALLTNTNVFVRGAVGEKFTDGDSYSYYVVEPGVKLALNKEWAVVSSYRFRDAFNDGRAEETHRAKIGAEYALTKTTVLTADVARSWGDSQYNSVNVGYGFKF